MSTEEEKVMTKDELLKEAMSTLLKAYQDTRTECKLRLGIPKLMREYNRILIEEGQEVFGK